MKKICIVGAGISGLPAVRVCLQNGFQPVCFEKGPDIGGLWRFKPEPVVGEGSVMHMTVSNTSKEMSAFSDFPPPADAPLYMHHTKVLEYIRAYCDHHKLHEHIRLNHTVTAVRRAGDYYDTGRWTVTYNDDRGAERQEIFDGVMVVSGQNSYPHSATFPGQQTFRGRIFHSHSYRNNRGFENQTVVVVGAGNSACDVAAELSVLCKQVYLSTRTGTWLGSRVFQNGQPHDQFFLTRLGALLQPVVPVAWFNAYFEGKLEARINHARYGLRPPHGFTGAHLSVNDELPFRIASGAVIVKPNIARFTSDGVIFEDGTSVDHVDTVILATGYRLDFSFLEDGKLLSMRKDNEMELYMGMYPPALAAHNTLACIGMQQPWWGAVLTVSELRARLFCSVLRGRTTLPGRDVMFAQATEMNTNRRLAEVFFPACVDQLAGLIGARPRMWELLFTDPKLFWTMLVGPITAYQYRLHGEHAWADARDAILGVDDRVRAATQTRKPLKSPPTISEKPRLAALPSWISGLVVLALMWFGFLLS